MKSLLPFLLVFIWLQACSQSPSPEASAPPIASILSDSTAVALGDSPDQAYRLFKSTRPVGEQTKTDLKVVRLRDFQQTLVSTLRAEATPNSAIAEALRSKPKFYWSKNVKYLLAENSVPDNDYEQETVLFDLASLAVAQRKPGNLLAFDAANDVAFYYQTTPERQIICFFDLKNPQRDQVREIIAAPEGKLPVVILSPKDRQAKVKAYTTGGAAVNMSFRY